MGSSCGVGTAGLSYGRAAFDRGERPLVHAIGANSGRPPRRRRRELRPVRRRESNQEGDGGGVSVTPSPSRNGAFAFRQPPRNEGPFHPPIARRKGPSPDGAQATEAR